MDERYINNSGKLVDYFCDYLERHFNEITDDITLREEFEAMWPVTKDYIKPEYVISDNDAFKMFKHAFGIVNDEMKENEMNTQINEETIRDLVAESLKKVIKEYGETPLGLSKVAKNTDRRASQLKKAMQGNKEPKDGVDRALDNSFDAERYLAQAIQNAMEAGMSDEQIQAIIQKNMKKNYNPKFGNGTLTYGKK